MNHQDWTTVILTKNSEKLYTEKQIKEYEEKQKQKLEKKKEKENEIQKPLKVNYEFKKALMQARLSKKISQKDLANKLNVPLNTISDYENGKIVPNNAFISKMEKVLNVKLPRIYKK
jgi:putative transcription factor